MSSLWLGLDVKPVRWAPTADAKYTRECNYSPLNRALANGRRHLVDLRVRTAPSQTADMTKLNARAFVRMICPHTLDNSKIYCASEMLKSVTSPAL